jgi:hypothetical protein
MDRNSPKFKMDHVIEAFEAINGWAEDDRVRKLALLCRVFDRPCWGGCLRRCQRALRLNETSLQIYARGRRYPN